MMKWIEKIGFFRLTLIPIGVIILISAWSHQILGMGIVGAVFVIYGALNKCLVSGKCDVDTDENYSKYK